jgi:16S rRNA (adenine1518-N6/adenine1519-N6)-dimethyltransferase
MISRMVLMFQREVGERLRATADEPAYGALSVLTALDWQITDHFRIEAGSFHPRPKVDAEVLCFVPRREQLCPAQLRPAVIEVIRAGFAVRRKNLRNALAAGLRIDPQLAEQALHQAGIASAQRAERLSVHDFVEVAAALARCSGHLKPVPDA